MARGSPQGGCRDVGARVRQYLRGSLFNEVFLTAGLPPVLACRRVTVSYRPLGVVAVIATWNYAHLCNGRPADRAALVDNVDMVAFTGSTSTGRRMAAQAG
jgi:acyl-CoA reductase-like NAD-dependent aldehyde dehydrogenase